MTITRQPVAFLCGEDWLLGVITRPEKPRRRGVVIVVGGPQYRAGSHRQFLLLANDLAAQGYAVMRFDYRGMGDSTGEVRTFENVGEDVRAAIGRFLAEVPEVGEVALWGLCDAASAALFYAHRDARVTGIALLNPWVRSAQGEARAYLKHYYLRHAFSVAPWSRLLAGDLDLGASLRSLVNNLTRASSSDQRDLSERMADALDRFKGRALLITAGDDLTAKEFLDAACASPCWRKLLRMPRVTQHMLPGATHTFSRREWRDQVSRWTSGWLGSW
jgi:exosortase A-associated hydrolase 1